MRPQRWEFQVTIDERALIERAQNGDKKAFDRLTEIYLNKAFSIAFRYTGSESDARDIVQDAFYKVFINLHRYDSRFPFSAWLFRILVNSSINFSKRQRRKRLLFHDTNSKSEVSSLENITTVDNNPEKEFITREIYDLLRKGLSSLPEKQRSAIVLFDLEGFSQQEVAEILRCPQGSVMSRLFYGRRKLKKFLEKYL